MPINTLSPADATVTPPTIADLEALASLPLEVKDRPFRTTVDVDALVQNIHTTHRPKDAPKFDVGDASYLMLSGDGSLVTLLGGTAKSNVVKETAVHALIRSLETVDGPAAVLVASLELPLDEQGFKRNKVMVADCVRAAASLALAGVVRVGKPGKGKPVVMKYTAQRQILPDSIEKQLPAKPDADQVREARALIMALADEFDPNGDDAQRLAADVRDAFNAWKACETALGTVLAKRY